MYATTAYLYQQIQSVLLIDTSGAYFDARWDPVYAKNLTLNLGVDNVILFQFQNQDQRLVNISGATFTFRIISQNGQDLLFAKELVTLNAATGRAKVTVTAEETQHFQEQPASYSIEISSGVLDQAVFTDDQAGARGVINLVNSVYPAFTTSQLLTVGSQAPVDNVYYTSTVTTDGAALTTFQLDTVNITGNITVQGATAATANTVEWYNVPFEDLATGNTINQLDLTASTERLGINVAGFHPYIRLELNFSTGELSQILYR